MRRARRPTVDHQRDRQRDLTQVIPGLGASFTAGDRVTVFGGVHRGFAPPRTEDVVTNQGGVVDLDPELSWNYELGVRSTVAPGLRLDGTLYRMDYENQIVAASLAGGIGATLTNGGATLHQRLGNQWPRRYRTAGRLSP